MKIIHNGTDRLTLRSDPYAQIIFGLLFALADLAIVFFFVRSVHIHCDRLETSLINCKLTDKLLGITQVGQRTVNAIQRAEVEESTDSDGDSTYKVVFVTASGRVSLTGYTSSGYNDKAKTAERINNYIQNGRQNSLDFMIAMEWWVLIFLLIFGGIGLGAVLLSRVVSVEMDRLEAVLRIRKRGLFGSSQQEILLREIEDIFVDVSNSSDGDSTYRIAFRLTTGEEIPMSRMYSSGRKGKQRAVDAMQDFLWPHRRFQDRDPIV